MALMPFGGVPPKLKNITGVYSAYTQSTAGKSLFFTGGVNAATGTPYLLSGLTPNYNFTTDFGTGVGRLNIFALSSHGDGGAITNGSLMVFNAGRGSVASPTALVNGDAIGGLVAGGYDGSAYTLALSGFNFQVDGAVSSGVVPIRNDMVTAGISTETWRADGSHYTYGTSAGTYAFWNKYDSAYTGINIPNTYTPVNRLNIGQPTTPVATVHYLVSAYGVDTTSTTLAIQAVASQTGNIQEWQDSSAKVLGAIDPSGTLILETQSAHTPASNTKSYVYTAVDSQNAAADALYIVPARYGGGRLYFGDVAHGSIYAANFGRVQHLEEMPFLYSSAGGTDGYFIDAARNALAFAVATYGYDILFAIPGPGFITGVQNTAAGYHRDIRFKSWAADADTMETSSATSNYIFDTNVTNTTFPHTKWRENGTDIFTLKADGGVTALGRSVFPSIGIATGATAAVGKLDITVTSDSPLVNLHRATGSASDGWNIAIGGDGNYAGRLKFYGEGQTENNWSLALLSSEDGWGASSTYRFSAPTFSSSINGRGDSDLIKWTNDGANSISGTADIGQSYAFGGAPVTFSRAKVWIGSTATSYFNVTRHTDTVDLFNINGSTGNITPIDGANIILSATTGMKIGTATSQKLGFYNTTPVVQQTNDLGTGLVNLGLLASASNITFTKEVAVIVKVADTVTAATAGAALSIAAGAGSPTTSGGGGIASLTGGAGQAGNAAGGAVNIVGGVGVGVSGGGSVNITGGAALTGGTVIINGGSGVGIGNIRLGATNGLVQLGHANTPNAHLDIRSRVAATDALSVDNVAIAGAIAKFKDNGSTVVQIPDNGGLQVRAGGETLGNTSAKVGGTIFDEFADVSVGGTEADIYTRTLVAGTLGSNGEKVVGSWGGNFVTVGTELTQLKVYFGGTAIWDSTAVAVATGTSSWGVRAEVIRVSATTVRFNVRLTTTGASGYVYNTVGELTGLTLANTQVFKVTGTSSGVGSGAGDIVGKMGFIEYKSLA